MSATLPEPGDDQWLVFKGPATGPLERKPEDDLPPTPQRVRRVRLWMILLLLTPVCLAGMSLLIFGYNPEPVVHPVSTPKGWTAITDAYFGYAVPSNFTQNAAWTDSNSDWFYGKPAAFVAETMIVTKTSPKTSAAPPASFKDFGMVNLTAFTVSGGQKVSVPGTAFGWEVDISRPGGWHAVALDTWEPNTQTQIWLLVRASPAVTRTVLTSLKGV